MPKLRRSLVTGAISTLAAALICSMPIVAPTATADPLSDAKDTLARLEEEGSKIDSDYAAIQEKLQQSRTRLNTTSQDLTRQEKKVTDMQTSATRVALTQFQSRGMDVSTQLFTSNDAEAFLTQLSTTQQIESNMNSTLQKYQTEVGNLESLKKTVTAETESISQDEKRLKDLQDESEKKVKEAESLVNSLNAQQRAALLAQQAQADREASNTATRQTASSSASSTPSASTNNAAASSDKSGTTPQSSGDASSRAQAALNFAISKVGLSYRMGATGPSAYDCSGLVQAAYASVGISLPRTSQSQFGAGRSVSRSELQPGDLVFFYSGISHVGIYMGNGMMVDARNSRVGVVYSQVFASWWPYAGARRVA